MSLARDRLLEGWVPVDVVVRLGGPDPLGELGVVSESVAGRIEEIPVKKVQSLTRSYLYFAHRK